MSKPKFRKGSFDVYITDTPLDLKLKKQKACLRMDTVKGEILGDFIGVHKERQNVYRVTHIPTGVGASFLPSLVKARIFAHYMFEKLQGLYDDDIEALIERGKEIHDDAKGFRQQILAGHTRCYPLPPPRKIIPENFLDL